ncbi:MAG TPA: RNA polymerase sigma factor [Nitrospirota bacterium]
MSIPFEGADDGRLVNATLSGDDEAFAELVRRYKRKVMSTASRLVGYDELDDVCQDIFMKVYGNLAGYRADAPFEHWLMRITVRSCYDVLRKLKRERLNIPLDEIDFSLSGPESENSAQALLAKDLLGRAMKGLKPDERLVVTLLELEEHTVKEVSELTGWSEANVKVRAFRARKALKQILGILE